MRRILSIGLLLLIFFSRPIYAQDTGGINKTIEELKNKISELQDQLERQFEVKEDIQDKGFWVAQLCPAFENTSSSQSDLKGFKGICVRRCYSTSKAFWCKWLPCRLSCNWRINNAFSKSRSYSKSRKR